MQIRYVRNLGIGAVMAAVLLAVPPAVAAKGFRGDPSAPVGAASPFGADETSPMSGIEGPSAHLRALVANHARRHGVPVALARAVVRLESNYNPRARGRAGEIGLMQIKPQTARGIGFTGSARALYDPDTNLRWGMSYLGTAYKLAGGSVCGTILRYNAGHYAKRMTRTSRLYCSRVQALMGRGSAGAEAS